MSLGGVGWILFLTGLPFSFFLFRPLDIWQGQNAWVQYWVVLLFAITLAQKSKKPLPQNWWLGLWAAWMGLTMVWTWTTLMQTQKVYPTVLLMPLFNVLSMFLLYCSAMVCWTRRSIQELLRWIARVGVVVMLYSCVQWANHDPFFHNMAVGQPMPIVGVIGNPTHHSAYLSFLLPILLMQPGWQWKVASALNGVLLIAILIKFQSVGGFVAALLILPLLFFAQHPKAGYGSLLLLLGGILALICHPAYLNTSGRLPIWKHFFSDWKTHPIQGLGLGYVMFFSQTVKEGYLLAWRHLHNEYLQVLVEQGLMGLLLLLGLLGDIGYKAWKITKNPISLALIGSGISFLLNAAISYPAHLWLLGSFGLLAYCGIAVLYREEFA